MNQKKPRTDFFTEETEMRRSLGLLEALSIVFGRIIGSGIFRTPGIIMAAVGGSIGLFYGGWLIGGITTLLGAFCYAEMVAMMPRSGGPYAYLRAAYPPVWSFLRGWAMFFVSETAVIVTVSLVFAEYGNVVYQHFTGASYSEGAKFAITFAIIWTLTGINLFGVRLSGLFQNFFGALKLLALLGIAALGFMGPGADHSAAQIWPKEFGWHTVVAIGAALRYSFFAYSGWEGATYVAEEVRNPRRNLPLSILAGIIGVMLLYLLVNTAYLYQLSTADFIKAQRQISSVAMTAAVGAAGGLLVAGAVMCSVFGNVAAQILAKGRTWFSMARDGLFPAFMGRLHPRYRTPNNALLAQAVWATVILIAVATFARDSYRATIDFFSFTSALFNVSTYIAVVVLRRKYPDVERPYRVTGYPVTVVLVVLIQLAFMAVTLYDRFWPSMLGILLTLSGLLYWYGTGRHRVQWDAQD